MSEGALIPAVLEPYAKLKVLNKGEEKLIVDLTREEAILHLGMALDDLRVTRDKIGEIQDNLYSVVL